MASTKDRLLGRRVPVVEQRLRDFAVADGSDPDAWIVVELRAMHPRDYEDLLDAHPPTSAEKVADPAAQWSRATYTPALIAASCVDPDLDGDFWGLLWANELDAEEDAAGRGVARVTVGEIAEIFEACRRLNERAPGGHLGKDSTPIGS